MIPVTAEITFEALLRIVREQADRADRVDLLAEAVFSRSNRLDKTQVLERTIEHVLRTHHLPHDYFNV